MNLADYSTPETDIARNHVPDLVAKSEDLERRLAACREAMLQTIRQRPDDLLSVHYLIPAYELTTPKQTP